MLRLVRRLYQGAVGMLEVLCRCLWWVWSWVPACISFLHQVYEVLCRCLCGVLSLVQASLSFLKKSFELVYNPEASQDKDHPHQARRQRLLPRWPTAKDFIIKVRIAGKTGGCEQRFLEDVSKRLSLQGVSLKVEEFRETSRHLLLVFCPIASRIGTDMDNALEELAAGQKAILVLMHYIQRDKTGTYVDAMQQVKRADVMLTVHTRYTLQEGLYPCKMNEVAVADVAAVIKDLA
ncbi:hypothetical protein JRQ81_005438 [Phrynocephalus forsythii]|uniref:Uncharacterized protein n=1 Tax=Phrynocephalus forsythii TaxID=171643 RepID=A0A9Q0Y517_9SAUR|nr:hypothetical protein JRQ81_005438 [Phrynocephalus forsythii]